MEGRGEIEASHLMAKHPNEPLYPRGQRLRHLLGHVCASGTNDELLVWTLLVDVVDCAPQHLLPSDSNGNDNGNDNGNSSASLTLVSGEFRE